VYDYLLSESYHLDGVQILPRRDNIRRAYRSLVDGPYSSDSEENLIQHETSLSKRMFDTQLKNLKDISNTKRLQGFELCISIRCILATTADQYTEILVPFVYGLKEKGAIVTVTRPSHLQGGPVQYNYDVPRAQRDEKIRTNSAFVSL
jgi:hypothetical protein